MPSAAGWRGCICPTLQPVPKTAEPLTQRSAETTCCCIVILLTFNHLAALAGSPARLCMRLFWP
jgi:hypothetical protein